MTLPRWSVALYEAGEMRAVDAWAIGEAGVPSVDLMERAGEGLARLTAEVATGDGAVVVVVGRGNNGGDGLVVARLLRQDGHEVEVVALGDLDELEGDPAANLERLPGPTPVPFDPDRLAGASVIVDAMLGTGFEGEPREPVAGAIAAIGDSGVPVVACDVPSGVNASTGEVAGDAVWATVTGTFHGAKIGLHVAPGALHAGRVEVIPIGVPRGAPAPAVAGLIGAEVLEMVPPRSRDGSKFLSGVVVVAAGSRGLTGAPTMVALAAQRTGAGYVQCAVPASAEQSLELRLLEAMTRGLPEDDGAHTGQGADVVAEMAERAGAVVLGPGIGKGDGAVAFARGVASRVDAPLVIDADGLNAFAGRIEDLRERAAYTVLTPHEGEMGRLLDRPSDEVSRQRLASVREAAERSGCVVLLKGDDTIVAAPGGPVAISAGATPALATAGTGDVLSGIVAALLSKGLDPLEAASAAVLAHARAGRAAAERIGGADHVVAGDVIESIPAGMRR